MFTFSPKSKLSARTKSGILLGRVTLVRINPDDGKITEFCIASTHVIPRLLDQELIIGWNQVLDWRDDEIIVADAAVPAEAVKIALSRAPEMPAHFSENH